MTALVSKTPLRQVGNVRELLSNEAAGKQLAAVAAAHMSPERIMRLLALSIERTPKLAECTPMSVLGCIMTTASLGLEPNTPLHHAYILPFYNGREKRMEAQFIVGYRGYIQMAHNSGQMAGICCGVHYSDDPVWIYRKGSAEILEHEEGPQEGEKLHAYASVKIKGGSTIVACWPFAKILKHRDQYSKGWQDAVKNGKTKFSPWFTAEDAMAMKTMIRQVAKFMPMSSEIAQAAALDGARADYAGFAMDARSGLPLPASSDDGEGEAEIIEGDSGEAEDPETPAETAKDEKPKDDPAPKDALADAREKAKAAISEKAKPAAKEEPDYSGLVQTMRNEMMDMPPHMASQIVDVYDDQLTEMKAAAPKQHAAFITEAFAREGNG